MARLLVCAALVALVSSGAHAFCRMTTSQVVPPAGTCQTGTALEWTRRCISYSIDHRSSDDFSYDDVSRIVQASVQTWLDVECDGGPIDLILEQTTESSMCNVAEFNRNGMNTNNISFVGEGEWADRRYDPNAYALTTVWHSVDTGQIYDSDMEINEGRGNPYTECPDSVGCDDGESVDLQNVVTHEMGHFLGIAHSDHNNVTMSASSPPGEVTKRVLRSDDADGLCAIYPPGRLPTECDFDPRGGLDLNCEDDVGGGDDPGGCACAIAASSRDPLGSLLFFAGLWGLAMIWRVTR